MVTVMYRPTHTSSSTRRGVCAGKRPLATRVLVLFLCGAGAAAQVGCGRKTAPRPPELVQPEVIESLAARNAEGGIALTWKRPTRYADGSRMLDLAGFEIQRSTGDGPFSVLTVLRVGDSDRFRQIRNFRYLDTAVTDGVRYRYRIVSFTLDRYFSRPSNIAEALRRTPEGKETQ